MKEIERLEATLETLENENATILAEFTDAGIDIDVQRLGNMRGREEDLMQCKQQKILELCLLFVWVSAHNGRLEGMIGVYTKAIREQDAQIELLETMVQHLASIKLGVLEKSPLINAE